jgi:ATP phosphoribosyltransferase regulatory subunit
LAAFGVLERVTLDLSEIHNLGYYTGITFEVLAPGVGFRIASGGRYDNLIGTFGAPLPAVGAALGLERVLLAHAKARPRRRPARWRLTWWSPPGNAAVGAGRGSYAAARAAGLTVALDLAHRTQRRAVRLRPNLGAPVALPIGRRLHLYTTT